MLIIDWFDTLRLTDSFGTLILKQMHSKMSSAKCWPYCLVLNVLIHCCQVTPYGIHELESLFIPPPNNEVVGGYIGFTPSVRPSRLPCPLCNIYSSGWILSILATNDHYHERVCRTKWPLTLTYIFKVIWPWLRKSCPLWSVYSSGWILFIFGKNDHYH